MGYSEARGTLIYKKNLKSKISCQTPFKNTYKEQFVTLTLHILGKFIRVRHSSFGCDAAHMGAV
jgi:hypothetical protein